MKLILCLVLLFGLAAPARAETNLLPNGNFEQGFAGWDARPPWRIVSLDGHAAGVNLRKAETARLCADARIPFGRQLRVTFVYVLRGRGDAAVLVGTQALILTPTRAPRDMTWRLTPTVGRDARFCVIVTARPHARFRIDNIVIEDF